MFSPYALRSGDDRGVARGTGWRLESAGDVKRTAVFLGFKGRQPLTIRIATDALLFIFFLLFDIVRLRVAAEPGALLLLQ